MNDQNQRTDHDTTPSETEPVYHYGGQAEAPAVSEPDGGTPGDCQEACAPADQPTTTADIGHTHALPRVAWPFPTGNGPKPTRKPKSERANPTEASFEEWYAEARKQTAETFPAFMNALADYNHTYDSVVHATAACALAAASAFDKMDHGGITGFQAGFVMWNFIKRYMSIDGPLKLVQYRNMLYPQYDHHFEKTIGEDTFLSLQEEAKKKLAAEATDAVKAHPDVVAHWQSIVDGVVPFGYTIKGD